jgi:hypothetical protein
MRDLYIQEYSSVGGGDAAATRLPGTNSWGEFQPQTVEMVCAETKVGPIKTSWCINSDGTNTTTTCVEASAGISAGPLSAGGGVSVCESTTVRR